MFEAKTLTNKTIRYTKSDTSHHFTPTRPTLTWPGAMIVLFPFAFLFFIPCFITYIKTISIYIYLYICHIVPRLVVEVDQRLLEGPDGILRGGIKRVKVNTAIVGLVGASMNVFVVAQIDLGKVVEPICNLFYGILNDLESSDMLESICFMQSMNMICMMDLGE